MSQASYDAYRFITNVVSPFVSRDKILYQLTQQTRLEWEVVANIASNHSIVQALYPEIIERKLEDLMPNDFMSHIHQMHALNCKRNEMMRKQLIDAVLVINNLGIKPLLMKGAAQLLLDTFSNISDRLMVDLDILLPSDEIKRVSNQLIATGYKFSGDHMDFVHTHHHYPPLIKQGECAMIELHRDLMFHEQQHVFPTEHAWANTIDVALPNMAEANVLVPAYRIFHSFLHLYVVDKLYHLGHVEIRYLHELARTQFIYSSNIDWDEMLAYAREHGVVKHLCANLYVASKFMNILGLEEVINRPNIGSMCHYIRVCSKLKYDWFDALDKKLVRRAKHLRSKFN